MGFLDHSTNNIIVDAVLTDVGREKLAQATTAENFVASYAFADDEVDYTLIKKYGTIVGKEKIEKNTPVFEASTNAELGVKSFLETSANPNVEQPTMELSTTNFDVRSQNQETTLNVSIADPQGLSPRVTYVITYDAAFLAPVGNSGGQIKNVQGTQHRKMLVISRATTDDLSVRFKRGSLGGDILAKQNKKNTTTQVSVDTDIGVNKRIQFNISYS